MLVENFKDFGVYCSSFTSNLDAAEKTDGITPFLG